MQSIDTQRQFTKLLIFMDKIVQISSIVIEIVKIPASESDIRSNDCHANRYV